MWFNLLAGRDEKLEFLVRLIWRVNLVWLRF
jgi:hypothetical protein